MDDMENEDIAAAMGFSSFGGNKKRKYDQTNSPKAKPDASGANTTRLGVRSRLEPEATQGPEDPITADEDVSALTSNDDPAQTKKQQKQKQKQPVATGLAAFLNRGKQLPERPVQVLATQSLANQDSVQTSLTEENGLPARPAQNPEAQGQEYSAPAPTYENPSDATYMVSFGGPAIPRAELATLRHGVVDENGDKAYFLPSFVEDPWDKSTWNRA